MTPRPGIRVWAEDSDARDAILAGLRESWRVYQTGDMEEYRRVSDALHAQFGDAAIREVMLAEISSGRNRHIQEETHG